MKKILLIYSHFLPEVHWSALSFQEKHLGVLPPLNLLYLATFLRKSGHEVHLIDLNVENIGFEKLIKRIKIINPDFLGFTITTYLFKPVIQLIEKIKVATNIPVIAGGFHFYLYPYETMVHKALDFGFIGYGHESLALFLENYGNYEIYKKLNGFCYRIGEEIKINPYKDDSDCFYDMGTPARDLINNGKYYNILTSRRNFSVFLSGTGCTFQCKFCTARFNKFRLRSVDELMDEIEDCYVNYGIREIDFYDQVFTINKKRTIEICKRIIEKKYDLVFSVRTRTDLVDSEMLTHLKKAGCIRIMYGIESGDQKILNRLGKKENIPHIRQVIEETRNFGIEAFGFFMMGCPGETRETIKNTINLAISLNLNHIQITRFTLYPGTDIYNDYLTKNNNSDYWREYIVHPENTKELPLIETNLTIPEVNKFIKLAYLKFYLRKKYIKTNYRQLFNLQKLKRGSFAVGDLIKELAGNYVRYLLKY